MTISFGSGMFCLSLLLSSSTSRAFQPLRTAAYASKTRLNVATDPAKTSSSNEPLFVDATRSSVQHYYGTELQSSDDLQTNACCTAGAPPTYIQECINNLHPNTVSRYYGCGLCLPLYDLTGCRVLDLGCGAGRDVYIASQLVGNEGKVVGVDMTVEQLEAAREQQAYHADKFGFDNVEFQEGYLESLGDMEALEKESFDVIISNCVINLCTDKPAVLKACYELLKPGGELYFSDVYANRRVPQVLQDDPLLWGECLSGALYWNDFENMAKTAGFADPRLVEDAPVTIQNKSVKNMVQEKGHEALEFYSATYRLFKMDQLEPDCEDYGQAVIYKGTIPRAASSWTLDKHHVFETGKIKTVCGNTWYMLEQNPQLASHFDFVGDFSRHYGIFEGCGTTIPYSTSQTTSSGQDTSSGKAAGGCC